MKVRFRRNWYGPTASTKLDRHGRVNIVTSGVLYRKGREYDISYDLKDMLPKDVEILDVDAGQVRASERAKKAVSKDEMLADIDPDRANADAYMEAVNNS